MFPLKTPQNVATNGKSHDKAPKEHAIRLESAVLKILTHPRPKDEQIQFFPCQ
jgi:hypothetical protein